MLIYQNYERTNYIYYELSIRLLKRNYYVIFLNVHNNGIHVDLNAYIISRFNLLIKFNFSLRID